MIKKIAEEISAKVTNDTEEYEICKYGYQIFFEFMICVVTCAVLAISCGVLLAASCFAVTLFIVRIFCGGIHLNKFWKCYILSCITILFGGILASRQPFSGGVAFVLGTFNIIAIEFLLGIRYRNKYFEFTFHRRVVLLLLLIILIILIHIRENVMFTAITVALQVANISLLLERSNGNV